MLPFKIPASSDHRCVWIKGEVPCNENNYAGKYLFFLLFLFFLFIFFYSGPDSAKRDDDDDDDDDDEISINTLLHYRPSCLTFPFEEDVLHYSNLAASFKENNKMKRFASEGN